MNIVKITCITILFLSFNVRVQGQNIQIVVNDTINNTEIISPFANIGIIYGLNISGSINLFSDTSYIRVLLMDTDSNEYVVTEIYPLLLSNSNYSFQDLCDETCVLDSIVPMLLTIKISDAVLFLNYIEIDTSYKLNIQMLKSTAIENRNIQKINSINNNIQLNKKSWIAGETFSQILLMKRKNRILEGMCQIYMD
jgi:hypothetical protein